MRFIEGLSTIILGSIAEWILYLVNEDAKNNSYITGCTPYYDTWDFSFLPVLIEFLYPLHAIGLLIVIFYGIVLILPERFFE